MNYAYEIINDCIKQLREVDIPRMQKLQVDIVLLRIKRFLLALEGKVTNGDCHRELGIGKFHADFTRLRCSSDIEAAAGCKLVVDEMADRLANVVENAGKKGI